MDGLSGSATTRVSVPGFSPAMSGHRQMRTGRAMFLSVRSPPSTNGVFTFEALCSIGRSAQHHLSGLSNLLQARGDIDAVAKDILALDDDVAKIDADPQR